MSAGKPVLSPAVLAAALALLPFAGAAPAGHRAEGGVVRLVAKKKPRPSKEFRREAEGNKRNGDVVKKLNTVLETLAKSEHDYQGHRASVMNEVGLAILHLVPQKPGSHPENPALNFRTDFKGTGTDTKQPKATSDEHMREALKELKAIETHLMVMSGTPQQARAQGSVHKAIEELNTALAGH